MKNTKKHKKREKNTNTNKGAKNKQFKKGQSQLEGRDLNQKN